MLGVSSQYLPRSYNQERRMHNMLFNKLFRPDSVTQTLTRATLDCVVNAPPYYLDRLQNITLARLTLGSYLSSRLLTDPADAVSKRWKDYLFIQVIRTRTFGRYLLHRYLKMSNGDFEVMKRAVTDGLKEYPGSGNWRFYLANKNSKSSLKDEL